MRISREVWQCELCGHEWIAKTVDPPVQCARCRKRGWHTVSLTSNIMDLNPDKVSYNEPKHQEIVPFASGPENEKGSFSHVYSVQNLDGLHVTPGYDGGGEIAATYGGISRTSINFDAVEDRVVKRLKSVKSCKECGSLSGVHARGCKKA